MPKTKKWGEAVTLVCPVDDVPLCSIATLAVLVCPKCNLEVSALALEGVPPDQRQERLYVEADQIAQEVIMEKKMEMATFGGAVGGGKTAASVKKMMDIWEAVAAGSPNPFTSKPLYNSLKKK